MRHNLVLSYDLMYPGQHYEVVQAAIKSLGRWYKFQYSAFYVSTTYTAQQAHAIVRRAMDINDKLLTVDAYAAVVDGLTREDIDAINGAWFAEDAIVYRAA